MSLFKILKGDSSRVSMDITPFHDGWAYFTPDDGGFYIDCMVNGKQNRVCVNSDSNKIFAKTFSASDWDKDGAIVIPASEHQRDLSNGMPVSRVYIKTNDGYSNAYLAAMETVVTVTDDKSVVLSYSGTAYDGKIVLVG